MELTPQGFLYFSAGFSLGQIKDLPMTVDSNSQIIPEKA